MKLPDLIIEHLKKNASSMKSDDPDFMVNDYAGGNIDDAYSIGFDDGYASACRYMLESFGIEYQIASIV